MDLDLQLVAQVVLGGVAGAVFGFAAGQHSNDERFWALLLAVGLLASIGNAAPNVPYNPVPVVLGVAGLMAFVVLAIIAMEFGLWTSGQRASTGSGGTRHGRAGTR